MRRILLYAVFVLIYLIRFWQFPMLPLDDPILKKLADTHTEHILKLKIVEEPNHGMFNVRAKTKLLETCEPNSGSEKSCAATQSKPKTFIQISYASNLPIEVGDVVTIRGRLQEMQFTPDQESLKNFFKKEKIFYEIKNAKFASDSDGRVGGSAKDQIEKPFSIVRNLVRFRKTVEQAIADHIKIPHAYLGQGLIISGKGSMSDELLEEFKRVGLIHIVVLSGSNVSIIATALMSILKVLPQLPRILVGVSGMTMFALMTGAAPPVVRSVLMSSIPLIFAQVLSNKKDKKDSQDKGQDKKQNKSQSQIKDEKTNSDKIEFNGLSLLCLTGYIMCLFNPLFLLYDISFQLSFMATLGLVLYTEPVDIVISKLCPFIPKKLGMREVVSSSLGTQILVAPLLLHISGQMSTVFLFANILVLPILPLTMFFCALTALASFINPMLAGIAASGSTVLLGWILAVTHYFSSLPFASVDVISLSWKGVGIYYAAVCVTHLLVKKWIGRGNGV